MIRLLPRNFRKSNRKYDYSIAYIKVKYTLWSHIAL